MITNSRLIDFLRTLPPDQIVVLAKDGEGNGFSPLADMEVAPYEPETTWSGHTYLSYEEVQTRIDNGEPGWSEEDYPPYGLDDATVLWPTN